MTERKSSIREIAEGIIHNNIDWDDLKREVDAARPQHPQHPKHPKRGTVVVLRPIGTWSELFGEHFYVGIADGEGGAYASLDDLEEGCGRIWSRETYKPRPGGGANYGQVAPDAYRGSWLSIQLLKEGLTYA